MSLRGPNIGPTNCHANATPFDGGQARDNTIVVAKQGRGERFGRGWAQAFLKTLGSSISLATVPLKVAKNAVF